MNHSAPSKRSTTPVITTQEMTRITLFTAMAIAAAVLARFGSSIVPFSLVPIVVFLAGGILGAKSGALSILAYMILGLLGLPVFASPPYGGFAYVLSPSFGFVPGFVLSAYVVGVVSRWVRMQESKRNSARALRSRNKGLVKEIPGGTTNSDLAASEAATNDPASAGGTLESPAAPRRAYGSLTSFIAANVAGILAYNAVGIPYLSLVLNIYLDSPTSLVRVLQIGLLPFIVPDLIKGVVAAVIARAVVRARTGLDH